MIVFLNMSVLCMQLFEEHIKRNEEGNSFKQKEVTNAPRRGRPFSSIIDTEMDFNKENSMNQLKVSSKWQMHESRLKKTMY